VGDDADILILGAGAAGLAAAGELSASPVKILVLEARDRIGGRIHTHYNPSALAPIELGAEFVHGESPEIFELVKRTGLELNRLPNRHWYFRNALLSKSNEFWSKIEAAMSEMAEQAGQDRPDRPFSEFLREYNQRHHVDDLEAMATLFVEGFHAAHADGIGVQGLIKTNEAADEIDDEKQFRPVNGYLALAQILHDKAVEQGVQFRFETVVREVRWRAGQVEVITADGEQFRARRLIVTLPLGVLQSGEVEFVPRLTSKEQAARQLAMGDVVKVVLQFREPFWQDLIVATDDGARGELKDFSFIHAPDELPPTWWTQLPIRAPLLVGWAGGTRAEQLLTESQDAQRDHALEALSHIFATPRTVLEDQLVDFYYHDWRADEFSRGAYSYIPVNGTNAPAELAAPIENTIYFAGEATNTDGHHGTVHGALSTGLRAAHQILQSR
jgi:monoamine oxidase